MPGWKGLDDQLMGHNGPSHWANPLSLSIKQQLQWAKNTYANRPPVFNCPTCKATGLVEDHTGHAPGFTRVACPTCDGHKQISASHLNAVIEYVQQAWSRDKSATGMIEQTGLPLDAIQGILMAQSSAATSANIQAARQAAHQQALAQQARDTRPEILSASLHTLKGKATLKLKCKGQRVYQVGIAVNQQDFKPDGSNQHKFTGTMTALNVSYEQGQVFQQIEVELSHHALIANGTYKPRSVLKTVGSIEAANMRVWSTQPSKQPQLPNSEPAADQFQPPKRRFNLK